MPIFYGSGALELNGFIEEYTPTKAPYSQFGPLIYIKKDRSRLGLPTSARQNSRALIEGQRILEEAKSKLLRDGMHEHTGDPKDYSYNGTSRWKPVFAKCKDELQQVAIDHNFTYGGWFDIVRWDKIDDLYSRLAHSLINGPLKNTRAHSIRVTTTGHPRLPRGMHTICVLMPDSFDREASKRVLEVLVKYHGWVPEGCKPDFFLELNLTHIHQAREYSCTFAPNNFFTTRELHDAKFTLAPRSVLRSSTPFSRGPKPNPRQPT
ncbi:hypothetical protein TWF694_010985 [Orbilia ellipsospora]